MTDNLPTPPQGQTFPTARALELITHSWLDGSDGTNRNRAPGSVKQIPAETDVAAIEAWLLANSERKPETLRSYRREAYRLYAWSIAFKEKPISSLNVEDVAAFSAWLQAPVSHPSWDDRGWVLFRAKAKREPSGARQSLVILQGMFRWLCEAGYLAGNPFKLHDKGAIAKQIKKASKTKSRRYLPHSLWLWLKSHMETALRPPTAKGRALLAYERQHFIVTFLYWTGVRRFELAAAMMSDVEPDEKGWILRVIGKGRDAETPDDVALLPPAMAALRRYRLARGLPEYPVPGETAVPLVAKSDGTGICDNHLNRLLKDFLSRAAIAAGAVNPTWPHMLRRATSHWLRHTLATHNAEAGVPMQATADQLRHASLETTRRVYTHVEARRRRGDLSKLMEYNELNDDE